MMDERTWSKARNLASAFTEAYDEDVAVVLGEALLEALAGLLVPEDERDDVEDAVILCGLPLVNGYECAKPEGHGGGHASNAASSGTVADAKRQHPAYLVMTDRNATPDDKGNIKVHALARAESPFTTTTPTHPEFLEGEEAYEVAPVGTITDDIEAVESTAIQKAVGGWFYLSNGDQFDGVPEVKRLVKRWGYF